MTSDSGKPPQTLRSLLPKYLCYIIICITLCWSPPITASRTRRKMSQDAALRPALFSLLRGPPHSSLHAQPTTVLFTEPDTGDKAVVISVCAGVPSHSTALPSIPGQFLPKAPLSWLHCRIFLNASPGSTPETF